MQAIDVAGSDVLPRARKARALLAILALRAPRPVARAEIVGLLWGRSAPTQALASLRQALHELTASLGPAARQLLVVSRTHIALHEAGLSLEAGTDASALDLAGIDPGFDAWLDGETTRRLVTPASPPAPPEPEAPGARRTRIGILPLRPLTPGEDAGLAMGLAEEITAALAPFRWLSCVASPSLGAIAEEARESSPAWRALDLDFLLEGTIQTSGRQSRIIVRLLDMRSRGEVVWARRFDQRGGDLLAMQEAIASAVAAQIAPELLLREGERATHRRRPDPTAHELVLRAIPAVYRLDPASFHKAGEMLEEAVRLDPRNASAHAWLTHWLLFQVGQGWATEPEAGSRRAAELAERAVALDPGDARALTLLGHVRGFLHRQPHEARALHERALEINPNLALAWCMSGLAHVYLGEHREAVRRIEQARTLSPHDPHRFFFDMALCMPHLLLGALSDAAEAGRRAIELNPACSSSYKPCLAALGHLGRRSEAAELSARLLALEPDFSVQAAVERSPLIGAGDLATYAEGLRRAGVPEQPACRAAPPEPPPPARGQALRVVAP